MYNKHRKNTVRFHKMWKQAFNFVNPAATAVSCEIQMKTSGKQVFLSFRSYYQLYGYNHKSQKVYFYK